ncbi:unnamed protein product, partial [Aureobasidium uvarum]
TPSGHPITKEVNLAQLECTDDKPDEVSNHVSDDEDHSKLRRVAGKMPMAVWLLSVASMCERFAYYAFLGPLQNYVQNPPKDSLRPGALGLGESRASLFVTLFLLISYLTPTLAA